jgi:hypothetical protein
MRRFVVRRRAIGRMRLSIGRSRAGITLLLCPALSGCGAAGDVPSASVTTPPVITVAPSSRIVPINSSWTFVVAATGASLRYQWRRNGQPITGATTAQYTVRPTTMTDGGPLDVVVSNTTGSVTTPAVELRVVTENGPWRTGLRIATSSSPTAFSGFTSWVPQAGVASLAALPGGRVIGVFQWFPFDDLASFDRVSVVFSSDSGRTWSAPRRIVIQGFPDTLQRPFDPTITVTADGRLRLFYTSSRTDGGRISGVNGFYSAISSDGVTYTFEPGARFVTTRSTVDCAVVRWNNQWHLVSPIGAPDEGGHHAISTDGLTFSRLPDISTRGTPFNVLGNLTIVNGAMRFYGTSPQGIWYADYGASGRWNAPTLLNGVMGGDPAVVEAAPGRWLMVVTQ